MQAAHLHSPMTVLQGDMLISLAVFLWRTDDENVQVVAVQRLAHHLQAHAVAALQVGHERLVPLVRVAGKVCVLDRVLRISTCKIYCLW